MRREDWKQRLVAAFETGREDCHGGCGDRATELRLTGKRIGAFCRECWTEIAYGRIPPLWRPRRRR
jgi:hypothetical protein